MRRDETRAADFTAYVDARRGYLRRTAYLICGDWDAADDLVQTALARLYVAWNRIRAEGAQDAYVRKIIVRAHLDEKRRPWRREYPGIEHIDVAEPDKPSVEDRDALLNALRELPRQQRATVVLRYWCGLSVEETAHELGCPPNTVKSYTARALARLRTSLALEEWGHERQPAATPLRDTQT